MTPVEVVIPLDITRQEVVRYLQHPREKGMPPEVEVRIERLLAFARSELISAKGIYDFFSPAELPPHPRLQKCREVGIAVVTIGGKLEREATKCQEAGRLGDALVLEAIGSAAVEAAANTLGQKMRDLMKSEGLAAGNRASPGYPGWDLSWQKEIFRRLSCDRIGVKLTPSLMMTPRKSVSFLLGFGEAPVELRQTGGCHARGQLLCKEEGS